MIPATPASLDLSVVVPAYDEIDSLGPLLTELRAALARSGGAYEIILVDDASRDGTGELIADEARRDAKVRAVRLERRSGQSAALVSGIARARGRVIVTMDAD